MFNYKMPPIEGGYKCKIKPKPFMDWLRTPPTKRELKLIREEIEKLKGE